MLSSYPNVKLQQAVEAILVWMLTITLQLHHTSLGLCVGAFFTDDELTQFNQALEARMGELSEQVDMDLANT